MSKEKETVEKIEEAVTGAAEDVKEAVAEKAEAVAEDVKEHVAEAAEKAEDIKETVTEKAEAVAEDVKEHAAEAAEKAADLKETVAEEAEKARKDMTEVAEAVAEDVKKDLAEAAEKAEDVKNAVAEKAEEVKQDLAEKAEDVKEAVAEKTEAVAEDIKEDLAEAAEKAEDIKEAVADKAEEIKEDLADKVDAVAEDVKEDIADAAEKAENIKDAVADKAEEVKDAVAEKAEDVKEELTEKAEKVKENVKAVKKETSDKKQKAPAKKKSAPKKYVSETKKMWIKIGIGAALILIACAILVPLLNTKSPILTNKTVITVDGVKVPADEYSYYVGYMVDNYAAYYGYEYFENDTNFNTILSYVNEVLKEHYVVYNWALEEGCELTEEEKQTVLDEIADLKATFETEEEYQAALESSHLTEELYTKLSLTDAVIDKFSDKIYDAETSKYAPAAEDVESLGAANGIIASKHILLLTGDDEEENAAQLDLANEILDRIKNGEDFDTLMNEYSEDTGLATNPDGYTFMPGEMVDEFYNATAELEVGEVSGIVPSSYGYHIIKRIEPDREETINRLISIIVEDELDARLSEIKIKLGKGFDKIQYSDFNLTPETEAVEDTASDDAA